MKTVVTLIVALFALSAYAANGVVPAAKTAHAPVANKTEVKKSKKKTKKHHKKNKKEGTKAATEAPKS